MKTEGNEPASPSVVGKDGIYPQVGSESWQLPGLTKREEFAKAAMMGMLINGAQTEAAGRSLHPAMLATLAVNQADALITALNKKTE